MTAAANRPFLPRWPGWQHLPREARDTLFQLGVIAWTVAPHLTRMPLWCTGLVLFILAWRARLALANAALPSRWTIIGTLVLAIGLTFWSEGTLLGKEAGVTMLVVLLTLKMLELRALRDALVVFFLGFFLVLTHFLYSQSLAMALMTLVSVWGLLTALVLANMPVGRPSVAAAGAVSLRAALWAVPLVAVLFLLFPRIAPLWGVPQDAGGRTGLSGSLRMGGVASLANDSSIVMRLRFMDGQVPQPQNLYFRGPVLGLFDGREWNRLPGTVSRTGEPHAAIELLGGPVSYELTVEPSRMDLLPLLELTPQLVLSDELTEELNPRLRPDLQWQLRTPATERLRLQARAWPAHRTGPRIYNHELERWMQLPTGFNPRTLAWAEQQRVSGSKLENADARKLADALHRHIAESPFTYTLEPGSYGVQAVDEFWLDRRLGFCEHYASAFVVIMRAWGIPARIVTGYQGAEIDPVDGWWVVRNSHAHAWAEYWQPGEGWVRSDPTAAVAPERVQRGQQLTLQRGLMAQAMNNMSPELMGQLRATFERLDNRWNQWVLNYSRGRQFSLLRALGFESPSGSDLTLVLIVLLSLGAAGAAAWAFWDRQRLDPWTRLQLRVQQRLARLGVQVLPHEAPRARAQRVRTALGPTGEPLAAALEELERARYGPGGQQRVNRNWWRGFRQAAATMSNARPSGSKPA